MHPIVISFVSLLAAASTPKSPLKPAHGAVRVHSLVQGSGTVVVFDDARDMKGGAK